MTSTDGLGLSAKFTVTVPLSETPGTFSAIVPVKLPDAPAAGSSVRLPLPPVTLTTPPASDMDTFDNDNVVAVEVLVSVTLPVNV